MQVFKDRKIVNWDRALRTFFIESTRLIYERVSLPDRVYSHKSILDEYSQSYLLEILEWLKNFFLWLIPFLNIG